MREREPARQQDRGDAGYTLVELLIVLTVIGLLAGLVGPRVLRYLGDSRVKAARLQVEMFSSSLDLFYLDAGRYPTTTEGLEALVVRPQGAENWNGPYIRGGQLPQDPWGNAYLFRAPVDNGRYEVLSLGADGREGGTGDAADISSLRR